MAAGEAYPSVVSALPSPLQRLRQAAKGLPNNIPIAVTTDSIAQFSNPPTALATSGDDVWEVIDLVLNRFVGFGLTVAEIATSIRRGPLGIDGLCDWLQVCMTELGIEEDLLVGKIERLIEAVELWCVISRLFLSMMLIPIIACRYLRLKSQEK